MKDLQDKNRSELKVNQVVVDDQERAINHDALYINYTADYTASSQTFIHNSIEILFVESGEAEYIIDGTVYQLSARSIFMIGAMVTHSCRITKVPYVRYGVYFSTPYLEKNPVLLKYLDIFRTFSLEEFEKVKNMPDEKFQLYVNIIRLLYKEQVVGDVYHVEMCRALVEQMSVLFTRMLMRQPYIPYDREHYSVLLEVKDYIDMNYSRDVSLDCLSKQFYMPQSSISRQFKEIFHVNLHKYITLVRVAHAVKLLEAGEDSMTEVGFEVGYDNINTFIRAFTRIMGISPLQYKKQQKKYLSERMTREINMIIE